MEEAPVKFSQEIKGLKGIEAFRANVVRLERPVGKIELSYSANWRTMRDVPLPKGLHRPGLHTAEDGLTLLPYSG